MLTRPAPTESAVTVFRLLSESEITPALFERFLRRQQVDLCVRRRGGVWVVEHDPFVDDWTRDDLARLISHLASSARTGGFVCGAFAGGALKGFACVDPELFGRCGEYADLTELHVSQDMRRRGVGRQLFSRAKRFAARLGAKKLYISAHSALESALFYRAMGCVEAAEYNTLHVLSEPFDCQLECPL